MGLQGQAVIELGEGSRGNPPDAGFAVIGLARGSRGSPSDAKLPVIIELAQGSRGSLPEVEFDRRGRVIELSRAQPTADVTESDPSKFVRLSSETFPDLRGPQLECLSDLCLAAHYSEEFFLSVATNQWVRTCITCDRAPDDLFSEESIVEDRSKLISSITIHSNVLPRDPFWTRVQAIGDGASNRVHFPCSILKEEFQEGNTLMTKLHAWRERGGKCEISRHGSGRSDYDSSRLFWAIGADKKDDVKPLKHLAQGSDGDIWQVTWRGGMFVRKDSLGSDTHNEDDSGPSSDPRDAFDEELDVVERLSHPHIVYSFGVSYAVNKRSIFMEYMEGDLSQLLEDNARGNEPPILPLEALDILLQFAKGMDHIHKENVVHGDLQSRNILTSKVSISDNVKHYLVKVADFGSAQLVSRDYKSTGFKPASGTTLYAAPEVLNFRNKKDERTFYPFKIDVYSFGIVAFEVLTGEEISMRTYKHISSSVRTVKRLIIEDDLRPPLSTECKKDNFLNNEELISLIESCWHGKPSQRPSFARIVKVLDSIRVQILEAQVSESNHSSSPVNLNPTVNSAGAHEEAASESNGHHPSPPVQANNIPDAMHGQVRKSPRRRKRLKGLLHLFSCVLGGEVQS